jgi:hypothetical protein
VRAVALVVVAALALATGPAAGEGHTPPPSVVGWLGGITHTVEGGERAEGGAARPGRGRAAPTGAVHYAYFLHFDVAPDGSRCVRRERRSYPDRVSADAATDRHNVLAEIAARSFPLCPGSVRPPTTPAEEAAEYWRVVGEDLLPRPAPRIAPGYMLAGKLAYLEAGTVSMARFEHPTPAGLLTIEAHAEHWVDWGDGSALDGPFDHPGGPWPHGTITHYWTDVGHYDVRVVQRWTGRWSLNGVGGDLAGLVTEGVVDDFPVEELQAVINR